MILGVCFYRIIMQMRLLSFSENSLKVLNDITVSITRRFVNLHLQMLQGLV